jgi:hypothetical protein
VTTPGKRPTFMDRVREAPLLVKIAAPIVLVLIVVAAASGGSGKSSDTHSTAPANHPTAAAPKTEASAEPKPSSNVTPKPNTSQSKKPKPEPADSAPTAEQRIRDALGDSVSSGLAVGDSEVRSVHITGQLVDVDLTTPEGGFEGPSTDDTDALASAALAKVYEEGEWRGASFVEFRGGLVNSATGRPLPDAPTVSYRVEKNAARQIDWSDEEALYNIDWSIYRALCYPAIKGC